MVRVMDKSKFNHPKKSLSDYTDDKIIQTIIQNAKKYGDQEYLKSAETRLCEIYGDISIELLREFQKAMNDYEAYLTDKNGKMTRATRTWTTVRKHGVKKAITNLVTRKTDAFGFTGLVDYGGVDSTFEALVLRFKNDFSSEAIEASAKRIESAKY